jgi:hypothetical protein
MSADGAWVPRAPLGCRDPKLWATAETALDLHNGDLAGCAACRVGVPCAVVRWCVEAQDRAMEPFTTRWLRGDDYLVARVHERAVERAKVRQCAPARSRTSRWTGWLRRRTRPQ